MDKFVTIHIISLRLSLKDLYYGVKMISKTKLISTINSLDEPISIEDVIERIIILEKIEIGLAQSNNNIVISDDDLTSRIAGWQK